MKGVFILCFLYPALSFNRNNEVYRPKKNMSAESDSGKSSNWSDFAELRDFFMTHVEDRQMCHIHGLKELVIKKDGSGVGWWARRCSAMSGDVSETSITSKKGESIQLTSKKKRQLNNLLGKSRCQPRRQMIDITNLTSPDVNLIPCSIQVKRCSGCCNSDILSCVPTSIRQRTFTVLRLERKPEVKRSPSRRRYALPAKTNFLKRVKLSEHTKCECQCKEKASHCKPNEVYEPNICQCICPESMKRICPKGKIWSENECSCICLIKRKCTTGLIFNPTSCICEFTSNVRIVKKIK